MREEEGTPALLSVSVSLDYCTGDACGCKSCLWLSSAMWQKPLLGFLESEQCCGIL